MAITGMEREQFSEWLRTELPRLLREDPRLTAELVGILAQSLGTRGEFDRILAEIKDLREDFARRFEASDQRFAAMDRRFEETNRRFEAVDRRFEELRGDMNRRFEEANQRFEAIERTLSSQNKALERHEKILRELRTGFGSLGRRFGEGFEESVRATIEAFSGVGPLRAERLILRDTEGELFGVPGQSVEFDAYVHDGRRFLVEVKSFAEPEDVLSFHRKMEFARRHLAEPFEPLLIAPFAWKEAVKLARELGIRLPMGGEEEDPEEP